MKKQIQLRIKYLDGAIKEFTKNAKKNNGSWQTQVGGRSYYLNIDDKNVAHLVLCNTCHDVAGTLIDNKNGSTRQACFKCEFSCKGIVDDLIYKGQKSTGLKDIGGFVIAKHPRIGVKIFDKNTQPNHVNENGKRVYRSWTVIKVFEFKNNRWLERKDRYFYKAFRGNWDAFRASA